jgi:hypothetical protein
MFIQVIQGKCSDEPTLRSQVDRWAKEVAPGGDGWLGGTFGTTDDGQFVGAVRFDSREAAERNSARPEQGAWWAETSRCFEGEVTFHDCDDVVVMLDGGSDDAGFVQVVQGRLEDPGRFRDWMSQPMDMLHEARPEIIGATIAIDDDGWFTETVAFRSEDEARAGESEMPPDVQAELDREMSQVHDIGYLDLRHPWFVSAPSGG